MARTVKYYTAAESRDSMLPGAAIDAIGRPANGGTQGAFVIVAHTKVEAAGISERALLGYAPRKLAEISGDAFIALRVAGIVDDQAGTVVAWDAGALHDTKILRWESDAARGEFTVVATWRRGDNRLGRTPVLLGQDPSLVAHRSVPAPQPLRTGVSVDRTTTRSEYVGGVHALSDGTIYVPGRGHVTAAAVRQLLSGLAGALNEVENR